MSDRKNPTVLLVRYLGMTKPDQLHRENRTMGPDHKPGLRETEALDFDLAQAYVPQSHEALVSIISPESKRAVTHHPAWRHRLLLQFEDFTDRHVDAVTVAGFPERERQRVLQTSMTADHAAELVRWVEALPASVTRLVVHCHGGFSRSPAVCVWASWRFGFEYHVQGSPNLRVLRLLCEASGVVPSRIAVRRDTFAIRPIPRLGLDVPVGSDEVAFSQPSYAMERALLEIAAAVGFVPASLEQLLEQLPDRVRQRLAVLGSDDPQR